MRPKYNVKNEKTAKLSYNLKLRMPHRSMATLLLTVMSRETRLIPGNLDYNIEYGPLSLINR